MGTHASPLSALDYLKELAQEDPGERRMLPVVQDGAGASYSSGIIDFFGLSSQFQGFVLHVSRGVQAAYQLIATASRQPRVRGASLEGAPEATITAIIEQMQRVMQVLHAAHRSYELIARGSVPVAILGPPFQFKLPYLVYNFLYQRQGDARADLVLRLISEANESGTVDVISDGDYGRLPRASLGSSAQVAGLARLRGLGEIPPAPVGTVVIVVAILASAVAIGWFISSSLKGEAQMISDYARTVEQMTACVQSGNCTQKQLDELIDKAPKKTDWGKIAKYGAIGVGIFSVAVVLLAYRSDIRAAGSFVRGGAAPGMSGLGRRRKLGRR